MNELYAVEGKQSFLYNHFKDCKWDSCVATDTRLMGVIAMKITWKSGRSKIYQILHLDFSEYGIDDYLEYFTDPAMAEVSMLHSRYECQEQWKRVSESLGGREISISLGTAVRLIEMAIETNEGYFHYHDVDIQEFRRDTLKRIRLMLEAAKEDSEYEEWTPEEATRAVCLKNVSMYETINYFVMRMCDKDYIGASVLSTMTPEMLQSIPKWQYRMMTLIHNRTTKGKAPGEFFCTSQMEADDGYFYARLILRLDMTKGKRMALVSSMECTYFNRFSEIEMAMQMRRPEYVSAYKIVKDPEHFDLDRSMMASDSQISPVPNGILYLLYNNDNTHVDTSNYYMNNDVYGAYLITRADELVIMSSEVMKISSMEMDLAATFISGNLELTGRYKFDSQVFQTFCEMPGATFEDILR